MTKLSYQIYTYRSMSVNLLFLIILSGQARADSLCNHTDSVFKCVKYVSNYDGDTITFNIPDVHPLLGKEAKVRVIGVDTPEIKGGDECETRAARIAKRLIESELKNAKWIELRNVQKDKYFRILADVVYDNKNMKDVLLKNKVAVLYEGGTKSKQNWCAVAHMK